MESDYAKGVVRQYCTIITVVLYIINIRNCFLLTYHSENIRILC